MVLLDDLRMVFRLWGRVYHHFLGVGLRLIVDGVTVVVNIRMESVVVGGVGDGLSPAVRKKHAVLSGHNVAVGCLVSAERRELSLVTRLWFNFPFS